MKRFDYDGTINFYHRISKFKSLDQRESDRLDELVRRQAWAIAQRKYREANISKLDAKRRNWSEENKDKAAETARKYRASNPDKNREACRRWREKQKAKQDV